jgi:hypothetical protein
VRYGAEGMPPLRDRSGRQVRINVPFRQQLPPTKSVPRLLRGDIMRAAQAPARCTAPRGGARAPRPYLRTRLRPSVGNDGHGQSHRTGKHTHSHHLLHTPRHATRAWSVPILKREQPAASARHCPAAAVLAGPPAARLSHPTLRCVASAWREGSATARAPVP